MNCPKCGNETRKVKISLFVKGNACSCGWCDFADKIKARPSPFSRLSSIFHTHGTPPYRWKFLGFRSGIPHFIGKHFARLPLYTEEEPIEIRTSARPKEEKTKEQPLYKIRKRGWREKRKGFKIGGSPPMNKRIKVHYLPIPMPKFMASAILALFMIILAGGYQYVHIMYPFIPSIPFLFFLNKPKEKCALKGCNNPVSEDSPFSVVKGRTLRFCSQEHADIYSNTSQFGEYERVQKMYGRRDLLKGIALAGLGAGVAGFLSGIKVSEAAINPSQPAIVSQFSQIGDASVVVFQDSNGVNYAIDKGGVTGQVGKIIASGTDFATVMMQAIDASRTSKISAQAMLKIVIKSPGAAGSPYIVSKTIEARWLGGVVIEGETFGSAPFLKLANGVNAPMFKVSGQGVLFRNLYLDGNSAGNPSNNTHGIEILNQPNGTSSNGCIIENCRIDFFAGDGVYMHDYVYFSGVRNSVINSCFTGVHFVNLPDRNFILGNEILTPKLVGIDLGTVAYVRVEGNAIMGGTDLQFTDINLAQCGSCLIIGNVIYNDAGYGIALRNSGNCAIVGNTFASEANPPYLIGIIGDSNFPPNYNLIAGNTFLSGYPHPIDYTNIPNTNLIVNNRGFNPQGFSITTPAMPASGTAQSNTFPFPVIVYLYGGTVTQITINGQVVFSSATGISLTGQSFTLNPRDTIAITYSSAPTWKWYGL